MLLFYSNFLFYLFSVKVELVLRDGALPDTLGQRLSLPEPNVDVNAARIERPEIDFMKASLLGKDTF